MVQELSPLRSKQSYINEILTPALGKGLGEFTSNYMAQKSLQEVLQDPSLKEAPISEKMSRLQQALMPHGERGQQMFQQVMQTEMQKMQEQQQQQQMKQQQKQQGIIAKAIKGEQLTPEEEQSLPQDVQIKLAQIRGKPAPGGVSAQPVPPQVSQAIPKILNANKEANADELATAFDEAGIPRAFSNSYIENRRRQDESKMNLMEKRYSSNKDYIEKITDAYQGANEMDMRLDQMLTLKDLPTPALATAMETLGIPSSLFSADAEVAEKLSIDLTKNIQQFYGSRILQSEFSAFLRSIPTLKNTPEGRQRIVENMKKFNELKRLEYTRMRQEELKYDEKNQPLPNDFRRKVVENMKEDADKLAMEFKKSNQEKLSKKIPVQSKPGFIQLKDPNGMIRWVPEKEREAALKSGMTE